MELEVEVLDEIKSIVASLVTTKLPNEARSASVWFQPFVCALGLTSIQFRGRGDYERQEIVKAAIAFFSETENCKQYQLLCFDSLREYRNSGVENETAFNLIEDFLLSAKRSMFADCRSFVISSFPFQGSEQDSVAPAVKIAESDFDSVFIPTIPPEESEIAWRFSDAIYQI